MPSQTPAHIPQGYKVRPDAWLRNFEIKSPERKLRPGDVVKFYDGSYHFIQYVNSSGAYAVPLSSITKEIKGHQAEFTSGGRTISAHSGVEVVDALRMGGNSAEFKRYVRLSQSLREGTAMVDVEGRPGAMLGEFDSTQPHDPGSDLDESVGHTVLTEEQAARQGGQMAKKAKAKSRANGAAKRDRAPKTTRSCACGCGTETMGRFAPGHDARLHGFVKRLASGKAEPKDYPYPSVVKKLSLTKTAHGYRATTPNFYKD